MAPPPLPVPAPHPGASAPITLSSSQQALLTQALDRRSVRILKDLAVDNPASKVGMVVGGAARPPQASDRLFQSDELNRGPIV